MSLVKNRPLLLVVLFIFCGAGMALGGGSDDALALRALEKAQELMAAKDFPAAIKVLEDVSGNPSTSLPVRRVRLLEARALRLQGEAATSAMKARRLLEQLKPDQAGYGRARWLLADAFEAEGKVDEAAREWATMAAEVASDAQRARIAGYYLHLAAEVEKAVPGKDALDPGKKAQPGKAAAFRLQALKELSEGAVLTPRPAITLKRARNLLDAKTPQPATTELTALLKLEDLSSQQRTESLMLRGESYLASGRSAKAVADYEAVLKLPNIQETPFAAEALFQLGQAYQARQTKSERSQCIEVSERFLRLYPSHPNAVKAQVRIAECYFQAAEYENSAKAWKVVSEMKAAARDQRADAAWRVGEFYQLVRKYDEADAALADYLSEYPDHGSVPMVQISRTQLLLNKAADLRVAEKPLDAVAVYRTWLERYPLHARAASTAVEIGLILRAEKKLNEAEAAFRVARERYERHAPEEAARAGYLLGVMAEEDYRDLPKAVASYRAVVKTFSSTAAAQAVRGRLAEMESVEISAACPRAFHPQEPAIAKLSLRNVKEVTLRLYRLNARNYFERKGSLQGADQAEIALVKADRTWTYTPKKFERYLKWDQDIPLALKEGEALPEGAYLLSVEAEERRTVVMVLVSSLRVVVKQSPYQVFCWVVDAFSGEPREGVELLVRGKDLRQSLRTDKDGVARLKHDSPQFHCRVLAIAGGSVAAGQAEDLPRRTVTGLLPRASFTFDSPIYRPGASIRWQATLRAVEEGRFVPFGKGDEVKVGLRGPTGRLLGQPALSVREFGVVYGEIQLPKDAALGEWSLELQLGHQRFQKKLKVQDYRAPDIMVTVEPETEHIQDGQEVSIEVAANYNFGGGVPEADFEWAVYAMPLEIDRSQYLDYAWFLKALEAQEAPQPSRGGQRLAQGRGRLNAQGNGRFSVTGPAQTQATRYLVQVKVNNKAGQWITGSSSLTGGPRDRFGVVMANQKAYRVGDTAKVRVITRTLGGGPAGTSGRLRVLLRSQTTDKKWVMREQSSLNVDTGLLGEAVLAVPLTTAGRVVLELSAKDGGGVPFVESTEVLVTGKQTDLTKEARLRFEREAYRAGTKARVHLDVPVLGRPVLLAFEAASVTEYRIHRPKARSEVLEILLDQKHAPNVVMTCALPGVEKLYTSSDRIAVMRYLETKVVAPDGAHKPGEEVTLKVLTRDQSGNPIAAALCMRAIDRALSALPGRAIQDPRWVFNRDLTPHLVRTSSTFDFKFKGTTTFMDAELLARTKALAQYKAPALFLREKKLKEFSKSLQGSQPGGGGGVNLAGRAPAKRGPAENKGFSISYSAARRPEPGEEPVDEATVLGLHLNPTRAGMPDSAQFERLSTSFDLSLPATVSQSPSSNLYFADDQDGAFRLRFEATTQPLAAPTLRERFKEVALWRPYVLTDERGAGALNFTLPDNLTTWNIEASGVSASTHAGLATAQVHVRQNVVARLGTPHFLRTGDEVSVRASVVSRLKAAQVFQIDAKALSPDILDLVGASQHRAEVQANGEGSLKTQWHALGAGSARIEVLARSQAASDARELDLNVQPFGVPWRSVQEAQLRDRCDFNVVIPAGHVSGSELYRVVLGGGANSSEDLIEGLYYCMSYPYGCVEQTVNRFLPAMLLAEMRSEKGLAPLIDPLRRKELVERGLAELRGFQNQDGSFGYWGGDGASLSWTTALVLVACSHADRLGYVYDTAMKVAAIKAGAAAIASASVGIEARAALAHALALAGVAPQAEMRALWRARGRMSVAGLSKLLLAFDAAGEGGMRQQLWGELNTRRPSTAQELRRIGRHLWPLAKLETLALFLQAGAAASAPMPELRELARQLRPLMRSRNGGTKAIAEALVALGRVQDYEGGRFNNATLRVLVDGKAIALPKIEETGGSSFELPSMFKTIALSASSLPAGKHVVTILQEGAGTRLCRLSLHHTQPAETVPADGNVFSVSRRITEWQDPKQKSDGFRPGWSVVKAAARPARHSAPSLQQAAVGEKLTVELEVTALEDSSFLAIREPLIAGLSPISESITGDTGRFERRASELLFFPSTLKKGDTLRIRYGAFVAYAGSFRAPPARVFEMYAPRSFGRSDSLRLKVFESQDLLARVKPPVMTPDERFGLARKLIDGDEKDFAAALVHLKELGQLELEDDALKQVLSLEIKAALYTQSWKRAAASFEELERRRPGSFAGTVEERRLLGQAYLEIGDALMARRHFQQVVGLKLARELQPRSAIAAVQGEASSLRFNRLALLRYPLTSDVQVAGLDLGHEWLGLRATEPDIDHSLPKVWSLGWRQALAQWASVAAWNPSSFAAEKAGRFRIELFQELGLTKKVVQEAKAWLAGYGESSREADKVVYVLAQTYFKQEDWKHAASYAQDLYDSKWPKTGAERPVWSKFRSQAALLLGRVAHVEGRVEDAVKWYARVKDSVPEAEQSWRFFREEKLSAPVLVAIGTQEKAAISFTAKNVKALEVGLYPVDLGVLFSVKKRFESLRNARLTGLDPIRRLKLSADRAAYLEQEMLAEFGALKPGAWLVVGQSEKETASSLLIVSDANLSVQHSAGYVRVALTDGNGKPVSTAQVTVAAEGRILHRGRTDERGMIAIAASVSGPATVVAEKGELVAVRTIP